MFLKSGAKNTNNNSLVAPTGFEPVFERWRPSPYSREQRRCSPRKASKARAILVVAPSLASVVVGEGRRDGPRLAGAGPRRPTCALAWLPDDTVEGPANGAGDETASGVPSPEVATARETRHRLGPRSARGGLSGLGQRGSNREPPKGLPVRQVLDQVRTGAPRFSKALANYEVVSSFTRPMDSWMTLAVSPPIQRRSACQ
jgi:hypothetical protein